MAKQYSKITGHLYKLYDVVVFNEGTDREWRKREFVLETKTEGGDGNSYRAFNKFTCKKSWVNDLNKIGLGSHITVQYTLDGRKWKPKDKDEEIYFNDLTAWEINVIENTKQEDPPDAVQAEPGYQKFDESDLPF